MADRGKTSEISIGTYSGQGTTEGLSSINSESYEFDVIPSNKPNEGLSLTRNASFEAAVNGDQKRKTHVRTGSDFWSQVASQTAFIDSSTRSSLQADAQQFTLKNVGATPPVGSNSTPTLNVKSKTPHHRFSVRDSKRKAKITRFYSHDTNQGVSELKVVQPLLPGEISRSSLAAIWTAATAAELKNLKLAKRNSVRKPSSWEESVSLQRRRSLALREPPTKDGILPAAVGVVVPACQAITQLAGLDTKDVRYCFQHPYLRLFTTLLVIFCNFLLFAEDPISHSRTESVIPMVGNVFSFICTKYPPDWRWALIKVLMWILAILCGLVMGKIFIHGLLFGKYLRLKMFRDEQGSWIAMFLTVILSLYIFSYVYNLILHVFYNKPKFHIDSRMGLSNSAVMKACACGTWLGDLITWLMVMDVMLQDSLYPEWAPRLRSMWRSSNIPRIFIFWGVSALATTLVVTFIVSDLISWDTLNQDFVASTELSRAFLASFILVLDLVIMMQDWDFPHFTTTVHINLPGFSVSTLKWKYAEVNLTGKWFSYGVIFMVMLLDLNMWKNQIFYNPEKFGQYVGPGNKIYTVHDVNLLAIGNASFWSWEERSKLNETSGRPFYFDDMMMNSRYMGYPLSLKCTAFFPSIVTLTLFLWLIYLYGRFPDKNKEKENEEESEDDSDEGGVTV